MQKHQFIILGAGPSGLALAHTLLDRGVPLSEILVLEKESTAGGLCRSEMVDGAPLDIGGGHFLDIKHQDVLDLLFRFMPESEWNRHDRVSKIHLRGQMVDHPLEANLWQFDTETQVDYLEAIAQAGCINYRMFPSEKLCTVASRANPTAASPPTGCFCIPRNMVTARFGGEWPRRWAIRSS